MDAMWPPGLHFRQLARVGRNVLALDAQAELYEAWRLSGKTSMDHIEAIRRFDMNIGIQTA